MSTPSQSFVRLRARKPVGGYVLLTVHQLCLLWWLYRAQYLQFLDLRVWLAAHEVVARRCQLPPERCPTYTPREVHALVGGSRARCSAALHRLAHYGLLEWTPHALTCAPTADAVRHVTDWTGFHAMLAQVPNVHRRVPLPRQTLRYLAAGVRPAVFATILGTCLRCLYYHASTQEVVSGGWCKGSWIADVFQLHLRTIKAARRTLSAQGWLITLQAPQRTSNRWGTYTQISLTWERPSACAPTAAAPAPPVAVLPPADTCPRPSSPSDLSPSVSPPPAAMSLPQLPPPSLHMEPLQELQHQEPALQAPIAPLPPPLAVGAMPLSYPAGVRITDTPSPGPLAPPTLHHIVPADLQDTERLLLLWQQAQRTLGVGTSASARLAFVATAEHAHTAGTVNPCGLFRSLIRHHRWHFATDQDEDAARRRLAQYDYGASPGAVPLPPPTAPPRRGLSRDALTVQVVQQDLARAGFQGPIWPVLQRQDPAWTRDRWERACAELAAGEPAPRPATLGRSLEHLGQRWAS